MGWQSCTDKGSFTRAILDALAKEYHFQSGYSISGLSGGDQKYSDPWNRMDNLSRFTTKDSVERESMMWHSPGLIKNVEQRYRETGSDAMKQEYESFMRITPCKTCKGQRLKKESLAVTVGDKNIYEITALSIEKLQ